MGNKTLVIGIDGATFDIIKPLIAEGRLPTFEKILATGAHGKLRSTSPAMTAPAWTSFMTGKNPGKHGLFHFIEFDKGNYSYSVINASRRRSKTIFRLAGEAGKKVISINVPVTYPPEPTNGIMISGMLSPKDETFTHPPELTSQLLDKGYIVDVLEAEGDVSDDYIRRVSEMTVKRTETACELLSTNEWDLAMVVFVGADRLQHLFWGRKEVLHDHYILLDGLIRKLIDLAGDSAHVMLMSDHGFSTVKGGFCVNQWLADNGYVRKHRFLPTLPNRFQDFLGYNRRSLWHRIKYTILHLGALLTRGRLIGYPEISINYAKSRAFARPAEVVIVNRKSRFANGFVDDKEYEQCKKSIAEGLRNLRDKEDGSPIIGEVLTREEAYSGDCIDDAPDIVLLPGDNAYSFLAFGQHRSYIRRSGKTQSNHAMNGIFAITGPDIKPGVETSGLSIMDCMPTLMHLLGLKIPEDVDGRIVTEIFREGSPAANRKPEFQESSQLAEGEKTGFTSEDQKSIEEKLKGLGYLT